MRKYIDAMKESDALAEAGKESDAGRLGFTRAAHLFNLFKDSPANVASMSMDKNAMLKIVFNDGQTQYFKWDSEESAPLSPERKRLRDAYLGRDSD